MSGKEALDRLRAQIDEVDGKLLPLLERRMEIVGQVAKIKQENNMPIFDPVREQAVIDRAMEKTGEPYRGHVSLLLRTVMALSRSRQRAQLNLRPGPLLPPARAPVRGGGVCAYQGVPGAWSEHALIKAFPEARRLAVDEFEDVFRAVRDSKADYGVIALENTLTGAIGETYDLMRRYGLYTVGKVAVDIRHCLLAPEGIRLSGIRTVYSHPQGLLQCSHFLRSKNWEQLPCRNTAVAAQMAKERNDGVTAAIGSRRAAKIHGLAVLVPDIMDSTANKTTFAVIAKEPEYGESSNFVSVTFSTIHRSGALCESLLPFLTAGVNLSRIESRPGADGNYRFFAELEGNIADPAMEAALRQAKAASEYFEVLGCYPG